MPSRVRSERGTALPTPVAAVSLAVVLVAGLTFLVTSGDAGGPSDAARPVTASATPTPTPTAAPPSATPTTKPKKKRRPAVRRGEVYVEVYNNSGISGLAGSTAKTVSGAGWQVVGSDNWYGTIPSSTVYFPPRLEQAGRLLARDLGIKRLKPAIAPMRLDRLTVILTADHA